MTTAKPYMKRIRSKLAAAAGPHHNPETRCIKGQLGSRLAPLV